MSDSTLSVATRAVAEACARLGLDADELLRAAGLTREQIEDPDARIPVAASDAFWHSAYQRSCDPCLALHAAEALPFGAYRVLDFLTMHAPSVGAGLTAVARYFPIVDARAVIGIDDDPGKSEVRVRFEGRDGPLPAPAQEYTFAALVTRSRQGSGVDWSPDRTHFTFQKSSCSSEHQRIFRGKLEYGAPMAELMIARAFWDAPCRAAQPELGSVLEQHARLLIEKLPPLEQGLRAKTRRAITHQLQGGHPSVRDVARSLGMTEKTLHRRLQGEGTTFRELLDECRLEWARSYLADRNVALSEVSWLLGFSEQSAFTRAFKRWTGKSPSEWRVASS